jgi:tRNA-specific 2-thiouridylase
MRLAQLSPAQLAGLLLPLGTSSKGATRAHAARLGLPVARKAESQDICFVEGGDYRDILARLAPETAARGQVVTTAGTVVGNTAGSAATRSGSAAASRRRGRRAT